MCLSDPERKVLAINIFVLDNDPKTAAKMQCDKHVGGKMIVESAQMLSTAHRMLDGKVEKRPSKTGKRMVNYWVHPSMDDVLYKAVHFNHPCTVWTRESKSNYEWLYIHFIALCQEYTYRYQKIHKTERDLSLVLESTPLTIPDTALTPFKLAMGAAPECINTNDPVGSYRKFYRTKKDRFEMKWTGRKIPDWF